MSISIIRAFREISRDPLASIKIPIGFILNAILHLTLIITNPFLPPYPPGTKGIIAGVLVSLLLYFFIRGYFVRFLNNILTHSNEYLPCWKDSKEILDTGIKFAVGLFTVSLPTTCAGLILMWLGINNDIYKINPDLLFVLYLILAVFLVFFYLPFIILTVISYSYDTKLSSFFNISRIKEILKNGIFKFMALYMMLWLAVAFSAYALHVMNHSVIVIVLISIFNFAFLLVWVQMISQWLLPED